MAYARKGSHVDPISTDYQDSEITHSPSSDSKTPPISIPESGGSGGHDHSAHRSIYPSEGESPMIPLPPPPTPLYRYSSKPGLSSSKDRNFVHFDFAAPKRDSMLQTPITEQNDTEWLLGSNLPLDAAARSYPVTFLGSTDVPCILGDKTVRDAERCVYSVTCSLASKGQQFHLLLSKGCVILFKPEETVALAEFEFENLELCAVVPENTSCIGLIMRTRSDAEAVDSVPAKPKFTCYIFEANGHSMEICSAIQEASRTAFECLLRAKTMGIANEADIRERFGNLALDK